MYVCELHSTVSQYHKIAGFCENGNESSQSAGNFLTNCGNIDLSKRTPRLSLAWTRSVRCCAVPTRNWNSWQMNNQFSTCLLPESEL